MSERYVADRGSQLPKLIPTELVGRRERHAMGIQPGRLDLRGRSTTAGRRVT
jgi:hypothetical protein